MKNSNFLRKLSTEKILGWTTLILILIVTLPVSYTHLFRGRDASYRHFR